MKKSIFKFFSVSLFLFSSQTLFAASLKPVFKTDAVFQQPESAIYDARQNIIYVSNIQGDPFVKDGKGFISKLDETGKVLELEWVNGLHAPKGLCLAGDFLYVADIDALVRINIKTKDKKSFPAAGAVFLNDVTCDENQNVYVSDMLLPAIYRLVNGQFQFWLNDPRLGGPNGVLLEGDQLYVAQWEASLPKAKTKMLGHILQIDTKSKQISDFGSPHPIGNLDGLARYDANSFVVSDWMKGTIMLVTKQGPQTIATFSQGTADITYLPEKKWLMVPLMNQNQLAVFEWLP